MLEDDRIHSVIACFGRLKFGAESDHVDEICEGSLSVLIEDGLHLSPSIAGSDVFQGRFVLDQATFFVFRHDP